MKNCINLTTEEVSMILAGGTKLVVPMKPQPNHDHFLLYTDGPLGEETGIADYEEAEFEIPSPFQPGQVIYGREKYAKGKVAAGYEPFSTPGYEPLYLSQCSDENDVIPYHYCIANNIGIEEVFWQSPATMPKSAARIFLRIESVEVKQADKVTHHEAQAMGYSSTGWQPSYSNPDNIGLEDNGEPANYQFLDAYIAKGGKASDWIWLYTFTRVNTLEP